MSRHYTLPRAPERERGGPGTVHHALAQHLAGASPRTSPEEHALRARAAVEGRRAFARVPRAMVARAWAEWLAMAARVLARRDAAKGDR